jgi:diamine N-acetyltransferase
MAIHVRSATPEDYDGLCAVFDQVDALHREQLPEIFRKPPGPVRERTYLIGLMADEDIGLFVAEVGNQIAGAIQFFVRDTPPFPLLVPRRMAVVEDLVVRREFRRRGIGQALMQTAYRWAAERGATSVELNVYEFNREAIDFYRALGYENLSRTMRHKL